jgi:multicomponent Na+:H+ antiporter subunit F
MILEFTISWIVLPMLSVALVLAFIRLAIGPTVPDRVIAFELIAILLVGVIVAHAIMEKHSALLDVASVWAVISFLSVVAISVYIEKSRKR